MTMRIDLDAEQRCTLAALAKHHPLWDFRRGASGLLALDRGEPVTVGASVLGVTLRNLRNGRDAGLVGLLGGHGGRRPLKLTEATLDTAVAPATAVPLSLPKIANRVRAAHPDASPLSLDRMCARTEFQALPAQH